MKIFPGSHSTGKVQPSPADTREPGLARQHPSRETVTMGAGGGKTPGGTQKELQQKDRAGLGMGPVPEISWFDQYSPWQSSANTQMLCFSGISIQGQEIALHIPSKSFQRAKEERKD